MKILISSIALAITVFFVAFAGLTVRSTGENAALFWQLERMEFKSGEFTPQTIIDFARHVAATTSDPDLRACAECTSRRSRILLIYEVDPVLLQKGEPTAWVSLALNIWRRPWGMAIMYSVVEQQEACDQIRGRCLDKFGSSGTDSWNATLALVAAALSFPLSQLVVRLRARG